METLEIMTQFDHFNYDLETFVNDITKYTLPDTIQDYIIRQKIVGIQVQVQLVYYTEKYKIKQNNKYNQFH